MKKCTSCGFIVNNDIARFCPECGKPVVDVMPEPAPTVTNSAPAEAPVQPQAPVQQPVMPQAPVQQPVMPQAPVQPQQPVQPQPTAQPMPGTSPYSMAAVNNEAGFNQNVPPAPIPPVPNNTQYYMAPEPPVAYNQNNNVPPMTRAEIVATLDRNIDMTGKALGSPWFLIAMISFWGAFVMELIKTIYTIMNPYESVTSLWNQIINQISMKSGGMSNVAFYGYDYGYSFGSSYMTGDPF